MLYGSCLRYGHNIIVNFSRQLCQSDTVAPPRLLSASISYDAYNNIQLCFTFCPPCLQFLTFIQSVTSEKEQIKQLVYNLENLTMNSENAPENVVWVIDFRGWTLSSTPLAMTRQSMNIIQNYYPGLVAHVILSNPPKIFQSFWKVLSKKTY